MATKAYGSISVSNPMSERARARHFVNNDEGAIVIAGTDATFDKDNVNTYGYNVLTGPDSLNLRYNALVLNKITKDGMNIYQIEGTGSGAKTVSIANFGATARIGKEDSSRFIVGADKLEAYGDSTIGKYFEVTSAGLRFGSNLEQTAATEKDIEDIQIGGRNILRGTANPTPRGANWKDFGWYTSGGANGTIEWGVRLPSSPIAEITNGLKLTVSKANAGFCPAQGGVPLRKGTVTLSAWVKGTAGDKVQIRPVWANANGSAPEDMTTVKYTIPDSDWHRYEATQVINYDHEAGTQSNENNGYANAGYIYVVSSTVGRVFYMAGIKLEYGNKATDWTASPDDFVDDAGNMLLDWDVPSLTRVKAESDRYWSDASTSWVTPSFQTLLEPPEEGIKYMQRYVVSTANSSAGNKCLAFYSANDFTTLPLKLNTPYTVSFWARNTSGSGQARVAVNGGNAEHFDLTSDWKRYTFTTTITTKPSNYYRVWIGTRFPANTTGTVEVCGCRLVAGIDGDEAAKIANAAAPKTSAIAQEQRIYYRSKVAGTVPKPTTWITKKNNKYNDTVSVGDDGWSTKVTPIANGTGASATKYLYLYTCIQRKTVSGAVSYTDVLLDDSTTVIDGGKIITGSIATNRIDANSGTFNTAVIPNLAISKITNLDTELTSAKNTANSYIYYTASTGLKLAQSNPSSATTNYVNIKANDIRIVGGNKNGYSKITSGGLEVFANINDEPTSVANFGSSIRLGRTSARHITIDSNTINLDNIMISGNFVNSQKQVPSLNNQLWYCGFQGAGIIGDDDGAQTGQGTAFWAGAHQTNMIQHDTEFSVAHNGVMKVNTIYVRPGRKIDGIEKATQAYTGDNVLIGSPTVMGYVDGSGQTFNFTIPIGIPVFPGSIASLIFSIIAIADGSIVISKEGYSVADFNSSSSFVFVNADGIQRTIPQSRIYKSMQGQGNINIYMDGGSPQFFSSKGARPTAVILNNVWVSFTYPATV